jgi:hypothetical protein
MERQELTVHPLLGYRLTVNPHEPDFVMVQFKTKAGQFQFWATRKAGTTQRSLSVAGIQHVSQTGRSF